MDAYNEALDYLYHMLPMYQRAGPPAYKDTLENTLKLDEYYNHPHTNYKTIHVAGTNGKGSVSHMLAAILQKAGYKTGLYTSPHLKDFRERIRIDGEMMAEKEVATWVNDFKGKNRKWEIGPSFFELTVAMAFDYFSQKNVDIAVIEVGLGGRLDSTNIITPEVSIITNIGLDHTILLGDSIKSIAFEKAGIIKKGVPVVIGQTCDETRDVFIGKAFEAGSPVFFAGQEYTSDYSLTGIDWKQALNIKKEGQLVYPGLKIGLTGWYQRFNVPAVLCACDSLKKQGVIISEKNIYDGLSEVVELTGIRGRWQGIGNHPQIICDTGHNEDGIRCVVDQLRQTPYKKLHIVFGMVADKDAGKILSLLPGKATYYFTKAAIPRALDEKSLMNLASQYKLKGNCYATVTEALDAAKFSAGVNDLIFVGGSTFVVAEALP